MAFHGEHTQRWIYLDVLLDILSVADLATQSRMMKTCHALYREGGKQLVRSSEIVIHIDTQLNSFLLFMRADGSSRIPYLRALQLSIRRRYRYANYNTQLVVQLFEELVAGHSDLKSLEYRGNFYEPVDARLVALISQLTALTNLLISDLDGSTCALLRTMHSLRKVTIVVYGDPRSTPLNIVRLLESSQATLESLKLMVQRFDAPPVTIAGPVYRRLQELALTFDHVWKPVTSHYIQAFPNLKSLHLGSRPMPFRSPENTALRASNRFYQQEHGSWPSLARFHGYAGNLHTLALTCRIEHLCIADNCDLVDATVIRDLLVDARPTRLDMDIGPNGPANLTDEGWVVALCEPRSPQVQTLTIRTHVDHLGLIEPMYGIAASLLLTAFHLDMKWYERLPGTKEEDDLPSADAPWHPRSDVIDPLHSIVDQLMGSCPSMQTVLVSLRYLDSRTVVAILSGSPEECARLFGFGKDGVSESTRGSDGIDSRKKRTTMIVYDL